MSSTISYSMDDKDLDDAALWAVIDSAAASHSVSSAKSCRPLAIRYPNFQSPPTPISHLSPPQKLPQNPKRHYQPHQNQYSSPQAKEAPETHHQRPHKMARSCTSEMSETASPLVLVGRMQRTPIATTTFSSPESYLSPGIGRFRNGSEASPAGSCLRSEENDTMRHSLSGSFPSVSLFKDYQDAAMAILEKSDYTMISGNPYIKKSGWRKISFYFNLSYEIKDKTIEFDENRNVQRAEFVVRAYMQGGRFSDGWGSCDRREKKFIKPNHDIPSTAETRAKNKACQDLLGIGEYRPGLSQFQR